MGIKSLARLLKDTAPSSVRKVELSEYSGKTVSVDVSNYLYFAAYNADSKGKSSHVRTFFEMIYVFLQNDVTPVFVFDGKPPSAKASTIKKRQDTRNKKEDDMTKLTREITELILDDTKVEVNLDLDLAETDDITMEDILMEIGEVELSKSCRQQVSEKLNKKSKIQKTIIDIHSSMFEDLKRLFDLCGVAHVRAKGEADMLCVDLCRWGIASATFSEDMDFLTHGSPLAVRGIRDPLF